MSERLNKKGYEQTRRKLGGLKRRLREIESRDNLSPQHRAEVVRSYKMMIQQYRREMEIFEAAQHAPSGRESAG